MNKESALQALKWKLEHTKSSILKDAILALHPELAESEDERIRKRLIDCLKFSLKGAEEQDAAGCSRQKDIEAYKWGIAYLEKQKDARYTKRNALFDKCVENCDPEVIKRVSDEIDAMLQKEQKSLSTEETELNSIAFLEQMGYTCIPPGEEQKPAELEQLAKLREMTREIREAYERGIKVGRDEVKPAEWCEGIKKTLDEISDYLKYKGREEDADFIRNLCPQPHWKPSEE